MPVMVTEEAGLPAYALSEVIDGAAPTVTVTVAAVVAQKLVTV